MVIVNFYDSFPTSILNEVYDVKVSLYDSFPTFMMLIGGVISNVNIQHF